MSSPGAEKVQAFIKEQRPLILQIIDPGSCNKHKMEAMASLIVACHKWGAIDILDTKFEDGEIDKMISDTAAADHKLLEILIPLTYALIGWVFAKDSQRSLGIPVDIVGCMKFVRTDLQQHATRKGITLRDQGFFEQLLKRPEAN